jgi:XTP/dITP diphosphohydrolase
MLASFNQLFIATKNKGKLKEFASLFALRGTEVLSLIDRTDLGDVEETGTTFGENALLKARTIAERTGLPVLADDSGLCVNELDGAPGVFSARFAGIHGDDAKNNEKLLNELMRVMSGSNKQAPDGTFFLSEARFVCALALYHPVTNQSILVEGVCRGVILPALRGSGGFGYDPLIYLPQLHKTMAELNVEEKNAISHRSQALRKLFEQLDG